MAEIFKEINQDEDKNVFEYTPNIAIDNKLMSRDVIEPMENLSIPNDEMHRSFKELYTC